ncbi:hypothetical protein D1821_04390 [Phaeobacter inhibens]|nr:hypothetical protein BWR17_16295 [Phaeobacter inhibens]AXT41681.1 hypothetical protein D1821_04390 [Phaeobacter inhibens]
MVVCPLNAVITCLVARQSGVTPMNVISCDWQRPSVSGILSVASYLTLQNLHAGFATPGRSD